ncbi:MAG: hypothetical protein GX287_02645 [Fusobacteria bacterium]|nr:hypothetical protein [Fusobacteriota bacterium]
MRKRFFDVKDIRKYGVQFIMTPHIEAGTEEIRYRIIGICKGEQFKVSETGKPLQAISELNNYFLKYSKDFKKISDINITKFDEELNSLEKLSQFYNEKINILNNLPSREYLEDLPMRSNKDEKDLIYYCKKYNIKGYTKLKKNAIITMIIEEGINNIK